MRRNVWLAVLLALVAAAGVGAWLAWDWRRPDPPRLALTGLREVVPERTVVLPTLDAPIPEQKNALWCASFQMAWERLKEDVAKGPVRLEGAEEAPARLNGAPTVAGLVLPNDSYAAAGFVRDGIKERIGREMAERFPDAPPPDLDGEMDVAVAFAYLRATARFAMPFPDNDKPLVFKGADCKPKKIRSFGLPDKARHGNLDARSQVRILHSAFDWEEGMVPFVADLSDSTVPYQVVVARVPRQPTLAATLRNIEARIAQGPARGHRLHSFGTLLVPHLRFRIQHRFRELEGRKLLNPSLAGHFLGRAEQRIDFRLDDLGARLETDAKGVMPKGSDDYVCNGPFVVLMRKRGETRPFFVLRVENGELLEPWE